MALPTSVRIVGTALLLAAACADARSPAPKDDEATPRRKGVMWPKAEPHTLIIMGSAELLVHPDKVMVGDVEIARVGEAGLEGALHHRVEALDKYLAALDPSTPAAVLADRDAPYGAVIDLLFAAKRAERHELVFAVEGRERGAIAMHGGPMWDLDFDERHREMRCATVARFEGETIVVDPCTGDRETIALDDRAAMERLSTRIAVSGAERYLRVEAPGKTPWATVVGVIDAMATDGCNKPDEPRSDTCRRWGVSLDLSPPLPWYAGDWSALEVSLFDIDTAPSLTREQIYSEAELRSRIEALLPQIRTCLRDAPGLRIRMPRCIDVMLWRDKGVDLSFAWQPGAPPCLTEFFGPVAEHPAAMVPGHAEFRLAIEIPGPTDTPAAPSCRVRPPRIE